MPQDPAAFAGTERYMPIRLLCLETARDLHAITLDQEAEAAELETQWKFKLPTGFRS